VTRHARQHFINGRHAVVIPTTQLRIR